MKLKMVIMADVIEGNESIGSQNITLNLPDTEDSQEALNCLAEGQVNFSKIAEQCGIAAVWMAGRVINKRLEKEQEDAMKPLESA